VEALKYVNAVRRHKWLVVGCLLMAIAAAALPTLLLTPEYSASTQLFVASRDESPYEGQLFSQQRVRSYADLVNSPQVMSAVIRRLDLPVTPDGLATRVSANVPAETVLITVTAKDVSPQGAQAIANTTAAQFSEFVERLEKTGPGRSTPVALNIVKPASLPTTPSSPRTFFNLGVGLLVGLVLGVGGALLIESLRPSPTTAAGEDLIAPIPFGPRRRSPLQDADDQRRNIRGS
jgi:capsular polysaccharide biosynthesis protein